MPSKPPRDLFQFELGRHVFLSGQTIAASGGARERGSVELVDKKAVTARELLGLPTDLVSEVDRFLVDDELFESERYEPGPRFRE